MRIYDFGFMIDDFGMKEEGNKPQAI